MIIYLSDTKPFELGRTNSNPDDWINSSVDINVNILNHRSKTKNDYSKESMRVNDLITRELLGRCEKYSEAFVNLKLPVLRVLKLIIFMLIKNLNRQL